MEKYILKKSKQQILHENKVQIKKFLNEGYSKKEIFKWIIEEKNIKMSYNHFVKVIKSDDF